ncbi:extracellular solute-binding protein [Microbacterium oryzae]|uniref:ABC transporter substrate-binding protein n=1 Tax=Microbacterium oryzae TaxID=743009 RepID=UPI0025B022ED|nr:extracellular solute-binding protein [Microbacterium oryzae]MDN3312191.1 extracellular solute-binding protein [Microbacterium oryzae]
MFTRSRKLAIAATAGAIAVALVSCSGGGETSSGGATYDPNEEVTLDFAFWGNDVRAEMYDEALAAFMEEHPNITVRSTFLGFPEFWEKRQTEAAGRQLPDVMQFSEQYLRQYTQSGLLLDLTPYLGNIIATDGFEDESFLQLGEVDGVISGIATSVNTWGLFTNADALDAAGVDPFDGGSWADYQSWMTEVTDAGGSSGVSGGTDWTGRIQNFQLQLRAEGSELFNEDGTPGFDEKRLAEFWESGAELRDGIAVPQQQLEERYPLTGMDTGLTASELNWDNMGTSYVENLGVDAEQIDLVAPPVTVEGAKDMYLKSSMLHTVSANTEQPEAAALLVDFLVNDPVVGEIFGTDRGVPASTTQLAGVDLTGIDAQVQEYEESIADRIGDPPPVPIVGYGSIEEKFRQMGVELGLGTVTVDQAVDEFFSEMDVILDQ